MHYTTSVVTQDTYIITHAILLLKQKPHTKKDNDTKHITLRISDYVVEALESDAARLGTSINSVSNVLSQK